MASAWLAGLEFIHFTGDLDGSDNWDYICSQDPEGTANAAENYPAFNWINTYNITYAAQLGGAKPAWYMPSLAELCEVYRNSEAINASLEKIRSLPNGSSYGNLSPVNPWFWSSSQYSDNTNDNNKAGAVQFGNNDHVSELDKGSSLWVFCLAGI